MFIEELWREHIMKDLSIYQIRRLSSVNKELNIITEPFLNEKFSEKILYDIFANCRDFHINRVNKFIINLPYKIGYRWDLGPNDIWKDQNVEYDVDLDRYYFKRHIIKEGKIFKCIICKAEVQGTKWYKHLSNDFHVKNRMNFRECYKAKKYFDEIHKIQTKNNVRYLKQY